MSQVEETILKKAQRLFEDLNEYFGLSFYTVMNYHIKRVLGRELAEGILVRPRDALEALLEVFRSESVVEMIFRQVLSRYCNDPDDSCRILLELCREGDSDGVVRFFAELRITVE